MTDESKDNAVNPLSLAAELTIAWLGNPNVRATAEEVPAFLKSLHATLGELSNGDTGSSDVQTEYAPVVPVRSSIKPDYIVSLITGQKLKSLKRHLNSHGLTPAEYRERYGLKADYPMVAPAYSAHRREVAKKLGLGRKGRVVHGMGGEVASVTPAPATVAPSANPAAKPARKTAAATPKTDGKAAPAKRGRPKKVEAPAA